MSSLSSIWVREEAVSYCLCSVLKKAPDRFREPRRLLDVAEMRAVEHLELGVRQCFGHGLGSLRRRAAVVSPCDEQRRLPASGQRAHMVEVLDRPEIGRA